MKLISFLVMIMLFAGGSQVQPTGEMPILVIDPQGHSAIIREVMFTPDGRSLISISDDKTIRVWDVENGILLKTLRGQMGNGPEGKLYAGALSPDGKTLAVAGYLSFNKDNQYGRIRLIDIETGEQIGLISAYNDKIDALAFSADGQWLASGSADDTIKIWNVRQTLSHKINNEAEAVLEGHTDDVFDISFSPDGNKIVSASYDHTLRVWRKNKQQQFHSSHYIEMKRHEAEVSCVAWSPDGNYIVSGGYDKKILLWDDSGIFIKELDVVDEAVSTISFSADSKKIVTSGFLGENTFVYAIPSGNKISRFTGHNNTVVASAFFRSDLIATAGGEDYDIYIWDANTGKEKKHMVGKGKRVWAVAFGNELKVLYGQSFDDINNGYWGPLEKSFDFSTFTLSLQGETALNGLADRTRPIYPGGTTIHLSDFEFRVSYGITIKNDPDTDGRIHSYTFTKDGDVILGSDFSLKLYRKDGSLVRTFVGHTGHIWAVSLSKDEQILASGSGDQTIKLWKLSTGELMATLFVTTDNEWICWNPEGYYAASAGGEKYIGWHVNRGVDNAAEYNPVNRFRKQFHKPELLSSVISNKHIAKTSTPTNPPPKVQWLEPVVFRQQIQDETLLIHAEIFSNTPITSFKVLVNGSTAVPQSKIPAAPGDADKHKIIKCPVLLNPGENRIAIFAANEHASSLSPERTAIYQGIDSLKPNLYVVSIGISQYKNNDYKLDFAHKDAEAIRDLFAGQQGLLFNDVETRAYYNQEATRTNIINSLQWLDRNVTHKDVAVVFISGHGYNEKGKYYILPHDGELNNLLGTAVQWENVVSILGNLPARLLLFLDTCNSGGLDLSGWKEKGGINSPIDNTEAIRELASEEYGGVIMAASTSKESSIERSEWGHGAFTKAIIEGLEEGKADYNKNGIIHLRELDTFVAEQVKKLTNGKQHTTTQMPSTISEFPFFQLNQRSLSSNSN